MLQVDLGEMFPSEARAAYLQQCISAAQQFITREGIDLTDSIEDGQLVEMYAAYLVRKRATTRADAAKCCAGRSTIGCSRRR